jgi:ribosomal protein L23
VALSTNKLDASSAVEAAFNVKVVSSTVQSRLGKSKLDRKSRNRMVRLPAKKIMMFKLKKGDKIDIFKA